MAGTWVGHVYPDWLFMYGPGWHCWRSWELVLVGSLPRGDWWLLMFMSPCSCKIYQRLHSSLHHYLVIKESVWKLWTPWSPAYAAFMFASLFCHEPIWSEPMGLQIAYIMVHSCLHHSFGILGLDLHHPIPLSQPNDAIMLASLGCD